MNAIANKRDRSEPWTYDEFSRDTGERLFQPRIVESKEQPVEPVIDHLLQVYAKYGFGTNTSERGNWSDLWNEAQKKWVLFSSGCTITIEEQACNILRKFNYDSGWMSHYASLTKPTPDQQPIDYKLRYSIGNILQKAVQQPSDLEKEFERLAGIWYRETRRQSIADQIVLHPAYQQIIGIGKDVLPFIFRELKKTRAHWLWALAMILRDDKAKPGMKYREAVDAWLEWGENNGYI